MNNRGPAFCDLRMGAQPATGSHPTTTPDKADQMQPLEQFWLTTRIEHHTNSH